MCNLPSLPSGYYGWGQPSVDSWWVDTWIRRRQLPPVTCRAHAAPVLSLCLSPAPAHSLAPSSSSAANTPTCIDRHQSDHLATMKTKTVHFNISTIRIHFRVATTVYQCLHGMALAYLDELCLPITASASRRGGLRSATTSNLVIPCCRLSTYGIRAFSASGPVCWNSLLDYLKSSDLRLVVLGSS